MKNSSPPLLPLALLALSPVACGSSTLPLTDTGNHATASDGSVPDGDIASGGRGCDDSPHGMTEQRVRYGASEVGPDEGCTSESQQRQCQDGTWSQWSGSYAADDCVMRAARDCDGVRSGDTETRHGYLASTAPWGEACRSEEQVRTCENGVWGAWSETTFHPECSTAEARNCDGMPHGTRRSRTRYAAAQTVMEGGCASEEQTSECIDGQWTDYSGNYVFEACTPIKCTGDAQEVTAPADCGAIAHGANETRVCFPAARIAYDQACAHTATQQERTCDNGKLGAWSAECASSTCENLPPPNNAARQDGGTTQVGDGDRAGR